MCYLLSTDIFAPERKMLTNVIICYVQTFVIRTVYQSTLCDSRNEKLP